MSYQLWTDPTTPTGGWGTVSTGTSSTTTIAAAEQPKRKRYTTPLCADDLRAIAKLVDKAEKLLFDEDGEFRLDKGDAKTGEFRVPVMRPDTEGWDEHNLIGHLIADDGWLGFEPLGEIA